LGKAPLFTQNVFWWVRRSFMAGFNPETSRSKSPLGDFVESIFEQAAEDPDKFNVEQRVYDGGIAAGVISYSNSFAEISVLKPVPETINEETNPYVNPADQNLYELEIVAPVFFKLRLRDGGYYDARYHQIFVLPEGSFVAQPVIRLEYDQEGVPTPFESAYHLLPIYPEAESALAERLRPE
jgi:hypothetical protein